MAILPNRQFSATAGSSLPGGQIGPGNQGNNTVNAGPTMIGPGQNIQNMQRLQRRKGILPQMGGMTQGFPPGMMQAFQQRQQMNPNLIRFAMPQMGNFQPQGQPMNSIQPVQNPNMIQMRGRGY